LHPEGALSKRLRRDLFHWPRQVKQNQRCTLHRWASNVELKDKVLGCTDCEVHLCVNCYQLFHMVPNLVDKKERMGQLFLQEQQERAKINETRTPESNQTFEINVNIEELLKEALTSPPVELLLVTTIHVSFFPTRDSTLKTLTTNKSILKSLADTC
jgi:hypothetical protein